MQYGLLIIGNRTIMSIRTRSIPQPHRRYIHKLRQVMMRMWASLNPSLDFIALLADNPDFYGPFWIPTTVIFTLFATSFVAISLSAKIDGAALPVLDISTLSVAAVSVYSYVLALPAFIYLIGRY